MLGYAGPPPAAVAPGLRATFVIFTLWDSSTRVCAQGEEFFFGDPLWLPARSG